MNLIRKSLALLSRREKQQGAALLCLMVFMALLEVVGVASVLPFLSVLADPRIIEGNAVLRRLHAWLGFETTDGFLFFLGAAAFVLIVLSAVVRTITQYGINRFTFMRRHSIGSRLLETYLRQPYEFYLNRHTGDMAKGILAEVSVVVNQVFQPAAQMIAQSFTLLALIALIVFIDPVVAIAVTAILALAYGLIFGSVRGHLSRIGKARAVANGQRFEAAAEALGSIKDIKLLGREVAYLERFMKPSHAQARHESTSQTLATVPRFGIEALAFGGVILLSLVLMVRYGGHEAGALGQILPLLGLYAFAGYKMLPAVQAIYSGLANLRFAAAAVDALYEDLAFRERLAPLPKAPLTPLPLRHRLQLDHVSYSYPGAAGVGLHDIALDIPAGGTTGIVGATGAGKTTLVDLILGLLPPSSGCLRVDGVELTPEKIRTWQANLGYVPQSIFLVDASVAENIALGIPFDRIDRARVAECGRLAQIHDFVSTMLPAGYANRVGERGVRLSGGQRQRIGIARALYHDPEVIVFDEATSALDNLTEKELMIAIDALSGTKTIIMIAHRLSTVRKCDRIVVMENGRAVGIGDFGRLSKDNKSFQRLVALDIEKLTPFSPQIAP